MITRWKFIFFVAAFVSTAEAAPPVISLGQIMQVARDNNPDIQAARQAWRVRQFEVRPAGTWANPTFTFVDENFPSGNEGAPTEKIRHYRIEQSVPFPGKLSLEGQMKYHESLIAEANYRSKEIEVLGDVRMRYFQLYLTDQNIDLAGQIVASLKSVLQTAQSRLASGQSSTSDVFMAQIELRKMENMLFEQQQQRTLTQIELNTLLNQPFETPWGTATPPDVIELPMSLRDFESLAKENAPQYWAAAHEENHAKTMLRKSRLEYAPDFDLMYEKEVSGEGPDGQQIGIGVSLPLWFRRNNDLKNGSREHILEAEAMSKGMTNMVMKMVAMEFTETTTHLTLTRNYERDILPTAESNLRVAREQYASGRGDFLRVLEAFRTWIETSNEYQQQLYHYAEHWSLLERWVGVDLNKGDSHAH